MGAGKTFLQNCRPRRVRAFSLVELIVVIGIIAVLIGLLLPTLSRVRASARTVTCASNLRQIAGLLVNYTHASDGHLPYQAIGYDDWSLALVPMLRGQSGFACPADETPRRLTPGYDAIRSYGVNWGPFTLDPTLRFQAPWPEKRDDLPRRIHKVRHHVFLVGDNGGQFAGSAAYVGIAEAEGLDGVAWGTHRFKTSRGDNYAFVDGHVEFRLKEELDILTNPDGDPAGSPADPWKWR